MSLIDFAAQYIMNAHIAILGNNLLIKTPIIEPINKMGIEIKAYWYWMIGSLFIFCRIWDRTFPNVVPSKQLKMTIVECFGV